MTRRPNPSLDRETIVGEAFGLLEDEGLAQLSLRKLAARLSVQAPALYWHVADKSELLGLMAGALYQQARRDVPEVEDWRAWLTQFGRSLKRTLVAHRDGGKLCAIATPVMSDAEAAAPRIAAPLTQMGLSEADALAFQSSVISLTLGWELFRENGPMHAFLTGLLDFDQCFERGLEALVSGYRPGSTATPARSGGTGG